MTDLEYTFKPKLLGRDSNGHDILLSKARLRQTFGEEYPIKIYEVTTFITTARSKGPWELKHVIKASSYDAALKTALVVSRKFSEMDESQAEEKLKTTNLETVYLDPFEKMIAGDYTLAMTDRDRTLYRKAVRTIRFPDAFSSMNDKVAHDIQELRKKAGDILLKINSQPKGPQRKKLKKQVKLFLETILKLSDQQEIRRADNPQDRELFVGQRRLDAAREQEIADLEQQRKAVLDATRTEEQLAEMTEEKRQDIYSQEQAAYKVLEINKQILQIQRSDPIFSIANKLRCVDADIEAFRKRHQEILS
ncbi:MAG: hypothetical protein JW769_01140 [Parachlamydiales bacterium]|nr:hypothetical protein [Parachlamydiales bacterium]